jgi:hypothetical protein
MKNENAPQDDNKFKAVKEAVKIEDYATKEINIQHQKQLGNGNIHGCCPVHGGQNISGFSIDVDKQIATCWTKGCIRSADVIELCAAYENLEKVEAVNRLIELFNLDIEPFNLNKKKQASNKEINKINEIMDKKAEEYFKANGIDQTILKNEINELTEVANDFAKARDKVKIKWIHFEIVGAKYPKEVPLPTAENLKLLLKHYGIEVFYNMMTKRREIVIPDTSLSRDNYDNASFGQIVNLCSQHKLKMNDSKINSYLTLIADNNRKHPAKEFLEGSHKVWDGKSRLQELYDTLTHTNDYSKELKELLIRKWLISCVAAVCSEDGLKSEGVLVLQGDQGLGKTYWFRGLVPEKEWFKEGSMLDPNNRDSIYKNITNWIVELGELESTLKKDIFSLKAFITNDLDEIRLPYERMPSRFIRQTSYCATVNSAEFLKDETGNRRFWVITCDEIDSFYKIDLHQLWGEVVDLYKKGESWCLTKEERQLLETNNKKYSVKGVLETMIQNIYEWETELRINKSASDIANDLDNKYGSTAIGKALKSLGIEQIRDGKGRRYYPVPPLKSISFKGWEEVAFTAENKSQNIKRIK